MANKKYSQPAAKKNTQVEYYPMNTMMNGVAMALFVALTVFFPLFMNHEKYADITRTKKETFFYIAVFGCILALGSLLLSYTTSPSSSRSVKSITVPPRKGLPSDILDISRRVLTVTPIIAAVSAIIGIVFHFIGTNTLPALICTVISLILFASSAFIVHFGSPREEQVVIKKESSFSRFLSALTLPDIAILLYWVCMVISALNSDEPFASIAGLDKRNNGVWIQTLYIAVYFIISRGLIFKNYKLSILTLCGTAVSAVAIPHYFGNDIYGTGFAKPRWMVEMFQQKAMRDKSGTNFLGSVGNINLLSYIIVICFVAAVLIYVVNALPKWDKYGFVTLPCCFIMAFGEKCTRTDAGIVAIVGAAFFAVIVLCNSMERLRRICIAFGVSALGWCLHLFLVKHHLQKISVDSLSKLLFCGGVLLIAVGTVLWLFREYTDRIDSRIVRYSAWSIMAVGVIAVLILAIHAAKTQTSGTFYEFGQILLGNFDEKFGNARGKIWMKSVHLIDESPLFGIGPDRFSTIFADKLGQIFKGKVLDKAHNEYLDVLICNGIIGLGLFMTFLVSLLVRTLRRSAFCRGAGVMAVVMFAYMIHAFFGYQLPLQSPVMWAMLGLAGASCFASDEASEPLTEGKKK